MSYSAKAGNTRVEQIRLRDRHLSRIALGGNQLRERIDKDPLVNAARPFERVEIERVLADKIARMSGADFTVLHIAIGFFSSATTCASVNTAPVGATCFTNATRRCLKQVRP